MLYNIQKSSLLLIGYLFFLTTTLQSQVTVSKYGTETIASKKAYKKTLADQPKKQMIPLKKNIQGLQLDLRYATTNNFTGLKMYPANTPETYLRKPAALALQIIQQDLLKEGLGLKIFDAYRPYSVTMKFWELIHDDRYVAHPAKGSGHNRGLAVDLTIISLKTGKELDMGSDFDHFSDTAHHSFRALPQQVLENRKKLKTMMKKYGFQEFETEWWHYSWPNDESYEVLDLPFYQLKN